MFPKFSKKTKGGVSIAFPDVCKTPAPPAPFVPIPYPNIAIASSNLKTASVKIQKFKSSFTKSLGDEAGTLKDIVSSVDKMSNSFRTHSLKVKAIGKKAMLSMSPGMSNKAFKEAQKQQKVFESQVKKECDVLVKACKRDPDLQDLAKELVSMVASAARGHPI